MLQAIKRWLNPSPAAQGPAAGDAPPVAAWAQARGYEYHAARTGDGFTVIGRLGDVPWRLEWGPSQRPYVVGHELRMRCEPGCAGDLSLVMLDRPLHKAMERMLYEQYVESVQTRIDNQTPPEMRWLVMSPRMSSAALGSLHDRFAAHGNDEGWLQQWLAGPFGEALQGMGGASALAPLVLVVGRGRLWLRTAQSDPDPASLEAWIALFECAASEARKACRTVREQPPTITETQPA